ncbi:MAG: thiamine pyrophosphate-binding protein [Proteobacteria bacterium]|nr:thiamine pyrophosphate-binding protein [Pseudomonadota bacterium]
MNRINACTHISPEITEITDSIGADILLQTLCDLGIQHIFGYIGGPIASIYNQHQHKFSDKITLINTSQENEAGEAAIGYYKSSGRIAAVLVSSGPGTTNIINSIADAYKDNIPVLYLTGQVSTTSLGKNSFQEIDTVNITLPITKLSYQVKSVVELRQTIINAHEIACEGRRGPVLIDIPANVTLERTNSNASIQTGRIAAQAQDTNFTNLKYQIKELSRTLCSSSKPMIITGAGISHSSSSELLKLFLDRTRIPTTSTLLGLGCVDEQYQHNLGMIGYYGSAFANFAISGSPDNDYQDGCDLLIILGARLEERAVGDYQEFARNAQIFHIDIEPNAQLPLKKTNIKADLRIFLELILETEEINNFNTKNLKPWHEHLRILKEKYPLTIKQKPGLIPTQIVMSELNRHLASKAHFTVSTGVGQHQMWTAHFIKFNKPNQFLTSGAHGTMGFGLPAAIGAYFANPDTEHFLIDGDRSFLMSLSSLETIKRLNIPIKIIVLDNRGHGMLKERQLRSFEGNFAGSEFHSVNYAQVSQSLGIEASYCDKINELKIEIEKLVAAKYSYLLQVSVQDDIFLPYMGEAYGNVKKIMLNDKQILTSKAR